MRRVCEAARAVYRGPWLRYKEAGVGAGREGGDIHESGGMICAVLKAKVIIALRRPLRPRERKIE